MQWSSQVIYPALTLMSAIQMRSLQPPIKRDCETKHKQTPKHSDRLFKGHRHAINIKHIIHFLLSEFTFFPFDKVDNAKHLKISHFPLRSALFHLTSSCLSLHSRVFTRSRSGSLRVLWTFRKQNVRFQDPRRSCESLRENVVFFTQCLYKTTHSVNQIPPPKFIRGWWKQHKRLHNTQYQVIYVWTTLHLPPRGKERLKLSLFRGILGNVRVINEPRDFKTRLESWSRTTIPARAGNQCGRKSCSIIKWLRDHLKHNLEQPQNHHPGLR